MKTELKDGAKTFYPKNRKEWRQWLQRNHAKEKSIWLIMRHKSSDIPGITYEMAVEEALCYGWIDSTVNQRDNESHYQYFSRRKPKSVWSKINRDRVDMLTKKGLMTPAGQALIDIAKKNGTWTGLDEIEKMVIPADLRKLFAKNKTAYKNFQAFPPSTKKMILFWIRNAKKPETRQQRIEQTIKLAAQNIRANQYAPKQK